MMCDKKEKLNSPYNLEKKKIYPLYTLKSQEGKEEHKCWNYFLFTNLNLVDSRVYWLKKDLIEESY